MDILSNLDLFSVGITIAGIAILGFTVFFSNPKSITNRSFVFFSVISICWGIVNYLNYKFTTPFYILLSLRLVIFFATWHAFSLLELMYVFPDEEKTFSKKFKFILFPLVIITSLLTLTPLVFDKITFLASPGEVSTVSKGPAILLFLIVTVFNIVAAFYILYKKTKKAEKEEKKQFTVIFIGLLITFFLLGTFNFLLPSLFDMNSLIPFGALFIFPFIAFTSFTIIRYKLFNIKVTGTALLTFTLSIVSFLEILYSTSIEEIILRISVFILILIISILLVKTVLKEVQTREKIELLARDLESANNRLKELDQQKTEFISFATHQLRGPLAAIKGYASLILEGDYGPASDGIKEAVRIMFDSTQSLVIIVGDYLNVSRIEQGRMRYDFQDFDLKDLVNDVVKELAPNVKFAGLTLDYKIPTDTFLVNADKGKIKEVISNLIDNSTKYTKNGGLTIHLEKIDGLKCRIYVQDTGIGIPKEVMPKLFEKFSRAPDASKTNIMGTGLGLFVAKNIIEAHPGGKIWAESEGAGKGSTFIIELCLKDNNPKVGGTVKDFAKSL